MTPDQAAMLMQLRGYTGQWHTPDRDTQGMVKEHEEGVVIFAELNASGNNLTLSYVHPGARHLRVTMGQFALDHAQFDKYESYVAKAALALCLCGV